MNFKEAMSYMLLGEKLKVNWWKKGLYVELRENGFYDNKGEVKLLEPYWYTGKWEIYKD
ncbi:MAG: hypothetical protein II309_01630 [Bacilli bacterium]|nr:hypothetical protein [Bacilli bacterium]